MKSILGLFHAIVFSTFLVFSNQALANLPSEINGRALPSLADMLEKVTPAVVNIHAEGRSVTYDPANVDPFFRNFLGHERREKKTRGTGSGVIIDHREGLIITNAHVIHGADDIFVTLNDSREYKATLVGADPGTDIAVLKIKAHNLKSLRVANSDKLRVGDFVVAIGNPYGIGQSVSSGIISALGRNNLGIEEYENFIQTDAPINPGNSGGALVNLKGELIGINTAILSNRSGGNVGIGFAIPSNMTLNIKKQLLDHGHVRRGQLGIVVNDLTPRFARELQVNISEGAVIVEVLKDSAAERAGLLAGDIVTRINGKKIRNSSSVKNAIGSLPISSKVELNILRNNKIIKIVASLGNRMGGKEAMKIHQPVWNQ